MFGFFKSNAHPHKRGDDFVWMTDDACYRGVLAEAGRLLNRGERACIGASNSKIANALKDLRGAIAVEVLEQNEIAPDRLSAGARGASSIELHLVGLIVNPDHEENLLIRCKDLSCKVLIHVHYSFTELVDAGIVEPSVEKLLRTLGARNEKAISDTKGSTIGLNTGRLLSRAIAKARRKAAANSE